MTRDGTGAPTSAAENVGGSVEHLFRHESGRIVSYLTRLLGPEHMDLAEEVVQEALLKALQSWSYSGIPSNPAGWLLQVARNSALDAIRHRKVSADKEPALIAELSGATRLPGPDLETTDAQLRDDELRMIFMCCHPALSPEASVALSLKTVGGFSVREIARAFLADESTVAQRLVRVKRQIRDQGLSLDLPRGFDLRRRLDSVLDVLYLMFNEGYDAHQGEELIRKDLCFEALRLAQLVAGSSVSAPRVHALVALVAFQTARLPARTDGVGDLVLLDQQDRSRWDARLIAMGFHHFDRAIAGREVSPFHVEAAIAATHTRAASPEETDWRLVLSLYDQLVLLKPSPVVALNRSVAVARVHGAQAALAELDRLDGEPALRYYYLLPAVRGQLLSELQHRDEAVAAYRQALALAGNAPERRFLQHKIEQLELSSGANRPKGS
ncbi:MAG TPA: sigma-70 family RNA polymerase sigma factor [Candidatus Eisenbacteria bacterium]|nr:sigma-70 family RNA polymerase sigma factor [Candidatus Eisenbacteria bacterium]